jgi:hypothetical protein
MAGNIDVRGKLLVCFRAMIAGKRPLVQKLARGHERLLRVESGGSAPGPERL